MLAPGLCLARPLDLLSLLPYGGHIIPLLLVLYPHWWPGIMLLLTMGQCVLWLLVASPCVALGWGRLNCIPWLPDHLDSNILVVEVTYVLWLELTCFTMFAIFNIFHIWCIFFVNKVTSSLFVPVTITSISAFFITVGAILEHFSSLSWLKES